MLTPTPDAPDHYPFQSLLQYTSSTSVIRRSGAANAIKYFPPNRFLQLEIPASIQRPTPSFYPLKKLISSHLSFSRFVHPRNSQKKTQKTFPRNFNFSLKLTKEKNQLQLFVPISKHYYYFQLRSQDEK